MQRVPAYEVLKGMAAAGRNGDTKIGHLTPGETVVPRSVTRDNPGVKFIIEEAMRAQGMDPGRYRVGGSDDSINPITGMPQYYGIGEGVGGSGRDGAPGGNPDSDSGSSNAGEGGYDTATQAAIDAANAARSQTPSRASPGGGYQGPEGAIAGGYTGIGPDYSAPESLTERISKAVITSMIPGLGLITSPAVKDFFDDVSQATFGVDAGPPNSSFNHDTRGYETRSTTGNEAGGAENILQFVPQTATTEEEEEAAGFQISDNIQELIRKYAGLPTEEDVTIDSIMNWLWQEEAAQ